MSEEAPKTVVKKVKRQVGKSTAAAEKAESTANQVIELKLLKFSPVYQIINNCNVETCGICRYSLSSLCNKCDIQGVTDCPVEAGVCGHSFHKHCLYPWLEIKSEKICPTCSRPWESV